MKGDLNLRLVLDLCFKYTADVPTETKRLKQCNENPTPQRKIGKNGYWKVVLKSVSL